MTPLKTPIRICSSLALGLALGTLGPSACIIDVDVGDDPMGDDGSVGTSGVVETTNADSLGMSSSPGSASSTSTSGPGSDSSTSTSGPGSDSGVGAEDALALCGVVFTPPGPEEVYYEESILCQFGCGFAVQSTAPIGLDAYEECLCEAMACGASSGEGTTGPIDPPGAESTSAGSGESDGMLSCTYPPGDGFGECMCEDCSVSIEDIDFFGWFDVDANGQELCGCLCELEGCGELLGHGGGGDAPPPP